MIRSRLFRKAAASLAAIILFASLLVLVLVTPGAERDAQAQIEENLLARATLLLEAARPALAGPVPPGFDAFIRDMGRRTSTRITIIRDDGIVIADSDYDAARMERHDKRPEIREARQSRSTGRATRLSRTTKQEMLNLAIPVIAEDRVLGFVRTALPNTLILERRATVRYNVALGAGGAALLGLFLTLLLTRRLTNRLSAMAKAARAIAQGDRPVGLPTDISDETGDLARDLEFLYGELARRMATITGEQGRLGAVLASMTEGVVAVDRSERVVHMNAVAAKLLRVSSRECVGRRIWEITRVQEVCEALDTVLASEAEHVREIRFGEGRPARVLEAHASPLRDGNQALSGAVIVLHDVTELMRLEVIRRDFVANVSHELKTPLTAIRGAIETLLDDESMEAETRKRFLGKARDQAIRLTRLVMDLLALSRIESEEGTLELRALDLRGPLKDCARRLDPSLEGRSLNVEVSLPEKPVTILGEEEAVRQIVDNLLDNALKYTPDGGSVTLRLTLAGAEAVVEVEDTGIGIEAQHLDRIFERFYRVDKARSRELGGTGLGLAIVKHLAEALGGRAEVSSEVGRGSTFRLRVPLAGS